MNVRTILLAVLFAMSLSAMAQEPPAAKKPVDKPAPAATPPAKSEAAKSQDAKEPATEAKEKPTKDSAGTPQRFIPTEQVRSDFDVSFPVDI